MTGNVGEKAQAVFFSFIMVMSMIAIGGAAFAGSAAADAPPESPTDSPGELQVSLLNPSTGTVNATWGVNTTSGTINITNGTETDTQVADITVSDDSAKAIQYAINNASAENDTVQVGSGTYNGSLSIDVDGLTLKGPNAGIAGDSDQRGAEATITDANGRLVIEASDVTIDGLNFEFDESAIQSKSGNDNLITNSRFELTGTTSDTYAVRVGGGSPGTDVTNNLFTDIVSSDGIGGDNVNGVVVTDPRDTRVANNVFSSVDTAVNAGDKSPEAGTFVVEDNEFSNITQFGAVALVNPDAGLDVDINNNRIESSRIGIGVFAGSSDATFSIQDNDFQNFANDEVFVDDSAGVLTLDDVLNTQGNTFDPDGEVVGDQIRVEGTAPADTVVNLDSGATSTGSTAIQDAVDNANSDNTLRVGPGTFTESVTVDVEGLTLEGPNAGIDGDSDQRGAEASFKLGGAITADNVTIDGVELTTGSGFSSVTGQNTVIRNTAADVDGSAVVRLEAGSDGTVITQNAFTGDGGNFAINARQSFDRLIDDVEITNNSFENVTGGGKTAIQAAGFTNANISGNSFDKIGEDAVRLAGNVSGTEVTNNQFSNYTQDSGFSAGAIVANDASGDNVDVSGNQFNDAGGDGVYVAAYNQNDPAALDLGVIADSNTFDSNVIANDTVILPSDPTASVTTSSVAAGDQSVTADVTFSRTAGGNVTLDVEANDGDSIASQLTSTSSNGTVTVDLSRSVSGEDIDVVIFETDDTAVELDRTTVTIPSPPDPEPSPDPANFGVSLSTPDTVTAGETATATATVENTGEQSGSQSISFSVDGEQVDSTSVSLDGGASQQVSFSYNTTANDTPSVTLQVASDDDSASSTVSVSAPAAAAFGITTVDTPETVTAGDTVEVTATVENTGEQSGNQSITLDAGGTQVDSTAVSLNDSASQEVTLAYTTTTDDAPAVELTVASDTDSTTRSVNVTEPGVSSFTVASIDTPGTVTAGEEIAVNTTIENTGSENGTQAVSLFVNGSEETSRSVTLAAGEQTTESFGYSVGGNATTQLLSVAVETANDTATSQVRISGALNDEDLQRFDDGDSTIERNEAVSAIVSYNTDSTVGGEEVTRNQAVQAIIAYNTGESIDA